ncbi:Inosine triphosphate pyrophosphatase [Zalerion maritima]|uniref:Inosine triphosphate pyrophosphatase n=1 Tax=Zalerion maritima TaxID=339359 RepID=A0AAD5WSD7_9PEZI|nr:Inosine triphosphate pyrophosphatase [Zalerion maritima]
MASKHIVNFVTGNANKLREVKAILEPTITVESKSLDLIEIQAATPEEVTTDKCQRAADELKGPVLVEDTCLCFDALNGLPGPYIKWFLTSLGHSGLLSLLAGHADKSAQAVCTFAFSQGPGHKPLLFQGRVHGKIVEARGDGKFGWDPMFEYQGKTYAEMDPAEKNKISHRSLALAKLKTWLEEKGPDAVVP